MSYQITSTLTERQVTVLRLLKQGFSQKEISQKMNLGKSNVRVIVSRLLEQFDCKNSIQLVAYCVEQRII